MRVPMKADIRSTSYYTHLQKNPEASLLLDDMQNLSHWAVRPHQECSGSANESRGIDCGVLTAATRDGRPVARLTSPVDCTEQNKDYGRGWGLATLYRDCEMADWSEYNRLIFDVYPDFPGFKVATMCIYLYTADEIPMPNDIAREGLHFVCLENNQWNTVTWEFPELQRSKVKGISFQYRMQGSEPGAGEEISLDFTNVRVERVDADHVRGWEPKEKEMIFSHTGYLPRGKKTALVRGLTATGFQVFSADRGDLAFEGPLTDCVTATGSYQIMDFSALTAEGRYILKAGDIISRPFSIAEKLWRPSIEKVINFFFGERCGYLVPGIHDICHADFQCRHGDVTKVVNGGWHDAGDLSQGLGNTAEAAYVMLCLADKVRESDPALYDLLLEEARWGSDWVLKTRFSDGYRASWLTMDFWTKGFLGDYDDIIHKASRRAGDNMLSAAEEALAARMFKDFDPCFARYNRIAAEEDYAWALEDMQDPENPMNRFMRLGAASQGCITSLELYKTTGKESYLAKAEEFADEIPLCQQVEYPDWDVPLRGFFYTGPDHRMIVHSQHKSSEQAPLVALERMLAIQPKESYRKTVELYAEYIKAVCRYTAPYEIQPASIYCIDEVQDDKPFTFYACPTAEDAREQIRNGIRLSDKYYLRRFPVWYSFRGNSGLILTAARAALACANILQDRELLELTQRTLEWHVGRNPFNQSLIWGEGYNNTPQYSAMSGDIVGSLPVGTETQGNEDIPYYPHANCYNYKEVWVFPALRWLDIMSDMPFGF